MRHKHLRTALAVVSVLSFAVTGCGGAKLPAAEPPKAEAEAQAPSDPAPATPTNPSATTPAQPEPPKVEPAKPEPPKAAPRAIPKPVRGIHLSGWYAGSPDLLAPLLEWCKAAGVNTLVMDIKAEDGKISWESEIPLAKEIGANARKIGDIDKFVKEMKDAGFWVVGRIVVMNDQYLYRARPAWTIPGFSGGAYSFMDPVRDEVYEYNMDIARAAVKAGVDEIQWDYIRYPYQKEAQPFIDAKTTRETRKEAINNFLRKAVKELHGMGVVVSADVFGLTTSVDEGDDMKIGQDYREIAEIVDYISAMMYPSHYAVGTYGLANPNAAPYDTVYRSTADAIKRSPNIPLEKHRPWIQDFTMHGVTYGPTEVLAQVKALKDLNVESFLLWDPSNKYSKGANFLK